MAVPAGQHLWQKKTPFTIIKLGSVVLLNMRPHLPHQNVHTATGSMLQKKLSQLNLLCIMFS